MNEWELLVAAESLEPGDSVEVELEDGDTVAMLYVSATGSKVKLLDQDGTYHQYSTSSLEELGDGNSYIVGKSEEELDAKTILRNARG